MQVIADDSPIWESWTMLNFWVNIEWSTNSMAVTAYNWCRDIDRSLWIQENPVNAYEPMVWATDFELLQRAL